MSLWLGEDIDVVWVHYEVKRAKRRGHLPKPDTLKCVDCGDAAYGYDHRNYYRPLEVVPVCHKCNCRRGPGFPFLRPLSGKTKRIRNYCRAVVPKPKNVLPDNRGAA